jgi:hypothetical protein
MTQMKINLPRGRRLPSRRGLEEVFAKAKQHISLRATLAAFPGCTHWHLKNGNMTGTLEATLWPREKRLWFSVQDGRRRGWIDDAVKRLRGLLADS